MFLELSKDHLNRYTADILVPSKGCFLDLFGSFFGWLYVPKGLSKTTPLRVYTDMAFG